MKRPAAKHGMHKKAIVSVIALFLIFLVGVHAVLASYNLYIDGILYAERLSQMREVTGQLFKGLEDVVADRWDEVDTEVNTLMDVKPTSLAEAFALMRQQAERHNFDRKQMAIFAVDSRGRYYTQNGTHGLLMEMEFLLDSPEQVSFVSNTLMSGESRMVFLQQLPSPVSLTTETGHVEFIYYGVSQRMEELDPYFVCQAYGGQSSVYVLDDVGARLFHSGETDALGSYSLYNALSSLNYLHGTSFEETWTTMHENGVAYSNVVVDGKEYYYAVYQMASSKWRLLFLVPSERVAINTVELVNTTAQIIIVGASMLFAVVALVIVFMLRRQQKLAVDIAVAEEKKNSDALKRANDDLQHAMEATKTAFDSAEEASKSKSDFLANMSHDIRTPMNAIVGMTTLIKHNANNPDKVLEYVGKVEMASDHLLGLINDVLDMSKIESGKTELNNAEFSLNDIVTQLDTSFRPQTDARKQTFTITTPEQFAYPYLMGDSIRLMQILNNVLSNAVKYTPNGGTIAMDVEETPRGDHKYNRLLFRVRDTGIGMSKEYIAHIFESFSREESSVTNKIQGTGLGMAIAKNLIDLMGGTIHVESELGKGSCFEIMLTFKIVEKASESELPALSEEEEKITLTGLKFLCAEDNPLNAEILKELLIMEGASCTLVENGQEAVNAIERATPDDYDIVLMDIQMPVMNGYDATCAIRSGENPLGHTIPIFAMTANAFSEDIQHSLDVGMDGHLSKPVDMAQLCKTVASWRRNKKKR